MKEFSFSDLSRRSGDVLDAALAAPVSLTKRGKPKIVMLPADQFERLLGRAGTTVAHTLATAPDAHLDELVAGFEALLTEPGASDDEAR